MEVYLNGEKLCVGGVANGVMNAMVDIVHRAGGRLDLRLRVGGLENGQHLIWTQSGLHVGDEIRIRIVEPTSIDLPVERRL